MAETASIPAVPIRTPTPLPTTTDTITPLPPPTTNAEPALMRRVSRILARTATFSQDVAETMEYLDIQQNVEDVIDANTVKPTAAQEAERILEQDPKKETPAQAAQRVDLTEKVGQGFLNPDKIMMRDKIVFFVGVVNVALIAYIVGRAPAEYYHYWTFKCLTLFSWRWFSYRKKGYHYLMLELCYVGNFLGIASTYGWPTSILLRKVSFAFGAGPLLWSIVAMRNSLIFHDVERTSTLMMHASPAITVWTLRWYPAEKWLSSLNAAQLSAFHTSSWFDLFVVPMLFYIGWVVFYYLTTFVLLRERIEGRGRVTMFQLMVPKKDSEAAKRSPLARTVHKFPEKLQPLAYLGCHFAAGSLSFMPIKLFWDYWYLHTLALLYCLGLSVWNGGNYYFKVFAKRYLAQLQEEAAAATAAGAGAKKKE